MLNQGVFPKADYSSAAAINTIGQILGVSGTAGTLNQHACRNDQGILSDLGTMPGGSLSATLAINGSGQIARYATASTGAFHAFLYQNGTMKDLDVLPGRRPASPMPSMAASMSWASPAWVADPATPFSHK